MAKKTKAAAEALAKKISDWSVYLQVKLSAEGDSVVASARFADFSPNDLRALADMCEGWTLTFGRSGANFRMIIW